MSMLRYAVFFAPLLIGAPWGILLCKYFEKPLNKKAIIVVSCPFIIQLILCSIFLESLAAGFILAFWTQILTMTSAAAAVGVYGIFKKVF